MAFVNVHTKEKILSLWFTMYIDSSKNIPSYAHISPYMVWRVHPQGVQVISILVELRFKSANKKNL